MACKTCSAAFERPGNQLKRCSPGTPGCTEFTSPYCPECGGKHKEYRVYHANRKRQPVNARGLTYHSSRVPQGCRCGGTCKECNTMSANNDFAQELSRELAKVLAPLAPLLKAQAARDPEEYLTPEDAHAVIEAAEAEAFEELPEESEEEAARRRGLKDERALRGYQAVDQFRAFNAENAARQVRNRQAAWARTFAELGSRDRVRVNADDAAIKAMTHDHRVHVRRLPNR